MSLRDRMRFYKLRMTPDAAIKAAGFNEQLKPELIPEQNDPFRVDWIYDIATEPFFVGEKVRPGCSDVEPSHVLCRRCGLQILKSRGTL